MRLPRMGRLYTEPRSDAQERPGHDADRVFGYYALSTEKLSEAVTTWTWLMAQVPPVATGGQNLRIDPGQARDLRW